MSICQAGLGENIVRRVRAAGEIGKVWVKRQRKIRSSLDLRHVSQKPAIKAELEEKSRCSAHRNDKINDQAVGNDLCNTDGTRPYKVLEMQARRVQTGDKHVGKK